MFGHVLRSDEGTLAFSSLKFFLANEFQSRKGRHKSYLFNLLISDLNSRDLSLRNVEDLFKLRDFAFKRKEWRALTVIYRRLIGLTGWFRF